jgi:large subunit ribosomal protein L35
MPKLKTRKGARKRMRVTASGRVKHFGAGKGHLLTGKRSKRKRALRRGAMLSKNDQRATLKLLPYGS